MKTVNPQLCGEVGAFGLLQYMQCEASGMLSRVVASPEASALCGQPYNPDLIDPLVDLTDRVARAWKENRPVITPDSSKQENLF
jgi:hypothetical protein